MTDTVTSLVARFPRPNVEAAFSSRPVDDDELSALLGAARVAPSADNLQIWRFVVVRSPEARARLTEALSGPLAAAARTAPVLVAVCGVRAVITRRRREQPFVWIDVPIALTHLLLQATEIGLGCAWTNDVDQTAVRAALSIPENVTVVAVLALGWPHT